MKESLKIMNDKIDNHTSVEYSTRWVSDFFFEKKNIYN